jgi:hypothetical protein
MGVSPWLLFWIDAAVAESGKSCARTDPLAMPRAADARLQNQPSGPASPVLNSRPDKNARTVGRPAGVCRLRAMEGGGGR